MKTYKVLMRSETYIYVEADSPEQAEQDAKVELLYRQQDFTSDANVESIDEVQEEIDDMDTSGYEQKEVD